MLRVIPNRLKTKAEELLAEEQAGFRADRKTCGRTDLQLQSADQKASKISARPLPQLYRLQKNIR